MVVFLEIQPLQIGKDKKVGRLHYGKEHPTDFHSFHTSPFFSFASQMTKLILVQVNLLVLK